MPVPPRRASLASWRDDPSDPGRTSSPTGSSTTTSTDVSAYAGPPPEQVTITVRDVRVESLPVGPEGPPSPYVALRVGVTHQTTAVRKRCAKAKWSEPFVFEIGAEDVLYVTVWDDVTLENLGEVWLTAPQLAEGWFPGSGTQATVTASLEGPDGPAGLLTLALADVDHLGALILPHMLTPSRPLSAPVPGRRPSNPNSMAAPSDRATQPQPADRPMAFTLTVVRAQALQTLLPYPNAFVTVRDGVSAQQTAVRPHSNDPVWDHPFPLRLAPDGELLLEIAHDDGCRGVSLATVRIPAPEVPTDTGPFGIKYTLRGPGHGGSAVLVLCFDHSDPGPESPPKPPPHPAPGLREGRRVAPVVRVRDPGAFYSPMDVSEPCGCNDHSPSAAVTNAVALDDPSGPCTIHVGVLAVLLTPSDASVAGGRRRRSAFVTLRCGTQYHKTAARLLDQDEVLWDEAFPLTLRPADALTVALQETDGAGVSTVGNARVKRSALTSMAPYHEMWVTIVDGRGDPAGDLLLAVTVSSHPLPHTLAPLAPKDRTPAPTPALPH